MSDDTKTEFLVKGMKCGGCITKATAALENLPGYERVEFDLEAGTAIVTGEVDPQSVTQALTESGYPATVKSA